MKYLDEFSDPDLARKLLDQIHEVTTQRLLGEHGFTVLRPRLLPPHDGGIALGQILVGSLG